MNDIVEKKSGGALAAVGALKGNLKKVQTQLPETQGLQYLRFLQDGSWVFGQENEEVMVEDQVAFNPLSIKTGWSCWTDRPGKGVKNENLGESMVPLGSDPIAKHDLPEKKDPQNKGEVCDWREQISVDLRFLSGPHKGKQVHYKTTSVGGIGAMRALIDQIILQLDEDPENIVPIVSLDGDHYNHKAYGRTYTPLLKITDWMSINGPEAVTEEIEKKPEHGADEPADEEDDNTIDAEAEEVADEQPDEQDEPAEEPRRRRRRR